MCLVRLRSAYVFVLLLLLVLSEGHFPIAREQRLFFPNPIRRLTNIVLTSFTLTTTETVNPTCFQLLNERIPVCQRKKRQIFWDSQSLGRNFGYRANFGELHTLPYPFALQYSRPVELFEDNQDNNLIEPSIKAPAAAEGRFFLNRPTVTITTEVTTITVSQMAGATVTNILPCFPPTGLSKPLCNPPVAQLDPCQINPTGQECKCQDFQQDISVNCADPDLMMANMPYCLLEEECLPIVSEG
ncbi:uncharacterized protein LOC136036092 isoform X2 [Artemia franciscana]|uniref:uncharacterized protein LOC136036092 isoform X2 n=1 Tax=Artemia franciscana TaxID=6661 RepID=UPI0032D9C98E